MKTKGLSQEALKLIACITMLIDHVGIALVPHEEALYYVCRCIGRLAFPVYCFLLVEGMQHTGNPVKYIMRLGFAALLAELPFDMFHKGGINWAGQSVMVTLTLGAVMLLCMKKTEKDWLKLLMVLFFALLAELTKGEYGAGGIVMIAVFVLLDQWILQTVAMFLVNWQLIPSDTMEIFGVVMILQLLATFAIVPIVCYSGEKLTRSKVLQWGFYLFYPIHLLLLRLILGLIR